MKILKTKTFLVIAGLAIIIASLNIPNVIANFQANTPIIVDDDGLIAYWTMDMDTATNVPDKVGGNDGTLTIGNGGAVVGKNGQAIKFDAALTEIDTGADMIGVGTTSVSVWIFPTGPGENAQGRIVENGECRLSYETNNRILFRSSFPGGTVLTPTNIVNNRWYHVVATRDATGADAKIYVDGIEVASGDSGLPAVTGENVFIGNNTTQGRTFDGIIDEVKIWNKVKNFFFVIFSLLIITELVFVIGSGIPLGLNMKDQLEENHLAKYLQQEKEKFRITTFDVDDLISFFGSSYYAHYDLETLSGGGGLWINDFIRYLGVAKNYNNSKLLGILNLKYVTSTKQVDVPGFK